MLLYIKSSPLAQKVLYNLSDEWKQVLILAKELSFKKSQVHYVCNRLHKYGLIEKVISRNRAFVKLSEKGIKLLNDIKRKK